MAGAPTEHTPAPDAPTRDVPTRTASAPPQSLYPQRPRPGVSLIRTEATPEQPPGPNTDPDPTPSSLLGPHPHRTPTTPSTPQRNRNRHRNRRTALLAAIATATAGAITAAVLLLNPGSPGHDDTVTSPTPSTPVSSTPTPTTPSPTVEGTSRPPGTRTESGLFSWIPPAGWKRTVYSGSYVRYTSPDGTQEIWGRASMATKNTTLLENWEQEEAKNTSKGQGYQRIRLEETTFHGRPAVVWEYTVTAQGEPWHARLLGFRKGEMSYEISTWYQADTEGTAVETYEKVRDSFTAL
ncbi:hypothetical protein [Streptomyces sp. SID13726]|uniref:hypothetical protein n=1 Tax=Streptomyces sp. SID13726 TaxID=2706058 RepID=UPI0013BA46FE|nr:hypothetical protein [Streptomyces sp. SID13726]NEB01779.1 hypothetical protein [Streptomyces sp. SID13726]